MCKGWRTLELKVLMVRQFAGCRLDISQSHLVFASSITMPARFLRSFCDFLQDTAWICTDGFFCLRIKEIDQKERDVILPRDASVRAQVYCGDEVTVSVRPIGYQALVRIDSVVHIPAAMLELS